LSDNRPRVFISLRADTWLKFCHGLRVLYRLRALNGLRALHGLRLLQSRLAA
jgi:hypothetical protein